MNDISEIDADPEQHAAMLGHVLVARSHENLDLDRTLRRADHARKLGEDTVTSRVDDTATVTAHDRQDHGLMCFEVADGGGLVLAHEPTVAGDVGSENRREPPPHREFFLPH